MNTSNMSKEIRKNIETMIFDHLTFVEAIDQLRMRVQDTIDGFNPCFEMLLGPSRCGKTEVLEALAREYPATRVNGMRKVPVLIVYVLSGGGTRALDEAVIRALGVPVPKNLPGENGLKDFMVTQLRAAKVRVILFDEASHVVEKGARIVSAAASDWFKVLHTKAVNIGIVMSGIPRLKRLIDENVQLRNRVSKPIILPPYRYDDPSHRKAFANCVSAFLAEFLDHGCTLEINFNDMVRHCYAVSAGHVGLLADFFSSLAKTVSAPCDITMQQCEQASKTRNLPGNGRVRPFHDDMINDDQLMEVLTSELDKYDLVLLPLLHANRASGPFTHEAEAC